MNKTEAQVRLQYEQLSSSLNERTRREWAASEAMALGYGGIATVHRATGMVPSTIGKGIRELKARAEHPDVVAEQGQRVRRAGAGRKPEVDTDPTLLLDLERLIDPVTRGDPMSPLRWTLKSVRVLATELCDMGHQVSRNIVMRLLHHLGYSLQGNRKALEGTSHPDRNAQFEHIAARTRGHIEAGNPAISVDTKKKELVGPYKNVGRELQPKGEPVKVLDHDFVNPELGRANPYGVYDIGANTGWVSVGVSHDTASFAVGTIRRWWEMEGSKNYPNAAELLVTADGGGSNGYRLRLWKLELQQLADDLDMPISVCHLPPGTSKWNKIEHRLFSFITMNWRGKPLVSYQTIVSLIAATRTTKGLTVRCELDERDYPKGRKVSDSEMATINLLPDPFHGEWNYTVRPHNSGMHAQARGELCDRVVS